MKNIATALVKAQKAFGPALKTSTNPHFKSRYADLSACVEAVMDGLNDNGIALIQKCYDCDNGVMVETMFVHESGEMLECGILHVPASKQDPQGYGSALTYARRYSLMAACGIAPEDDDGNAASKKPAPIITPRAGIGEDLPNDIKEFLKEMALSVTELVKDGQAVNALAMIDEQQLEADQKVYLSNQLDAPTRSAIKKAKNGTA
jgi:hypothetical protein